MDLVGHPRWCRLEFSEVLLRVLWVRAHRWVAWRLQLIEDLRGLIHLRIHQEVLKLAVGYHLGSYDWLLEETAVLAKLNSLSGGNLRMIQYFPLKVTIQPWVSHEAVWAPEQGRLSILLVDNGAVGDNGMILGIDYSNGLQGNSISLHWVLWNTCETISLQDWLEQVILNNVLDLYWSGQACAPSWVQLAILRSDSLHHDLLRHGLAEDRDHILGWLNLSCHYVLTIKNGTGIDLFR